MILVTLRVSSLIKPQHHPLPGAEGGQGELALIPCPAVVAAHTRLFEHGCDFGAGNCQEVKPFPPGHGSVHGLDEAQNIGVLLDAVKMYILGIKAIDDLWS